MQQQKFSVSMCVYGGDDPVWFKTAIDSILHQTMPPDEVALVVDGPVPEELDAVIREYEAMTCFKVVRLPKNRGHGEARRASLAACTHELVALMDADDISVPDRFARQLALFETQPELDIVGGIIHEFIDTPDNVVGVREVPCEDTDIKEYMRTRCPMNQMTVMFRKSSVEKVGGYVDWFCNEDYYLWLRMYLAGMTFANLSENLVHVRVGKEMYQRRGGWRYFKSEARLQNWMLKHKVIGPVTWTVNVAKRLVVQVLLPNRLRGWVFQTFARKAAE